MKIGGMRFSRDMVLALLRFIPRYYHLIRLLHDAIPPMAQSPESVVHTLALYSIAYSSCSIQNHSFLRYHAFKSWTGFSSVKYT